jgi:hypothetical protein
MFVTLHPLITLMYQTGHPEYRASRNQSNAQKKVHATRPETAAAEGADSLCTLDFPSRIFGYAPPFAEYHGFERKKTLKI